MKYLTKVSGQVPLNGVALGYHLPIKLQQRQLTKRGTFQIGILVVYRFQRHCKCHNTDEKIRCLYQIDSNLEESRRYRDNEADSSKLQP